jgi:hypothetical protein
MESLRSSSSHSAETSVSDSIHVVVKLGDWSASSSPGGMT